MPERALRPDVTCEAGRYFLDAPRLPNICFGCGATPLPKGRRVWCSDKCSRRVYEAFMREHDWGTASKAALRRDGRICVKCGANGRIPKDALAALSEIKDHRARYAAEGKLEVIYGLEVNHIIPRVGRGYHIGCHNHLDNLETLCHRCHVEVTKAQLRERAAAASSQVALLESTVS